MATIKSLWACVRIVLVLSALRLSGLAQVQVGIADGLSGQPGDDITVPVVMTEAVGVESIDFQLRFDTSVLDLLENPVTPGFELGGADLFLSNPDDVAGKITVGIALLEARTIPAGIMLEVHFRITAGAAAGSTPLDLARVSFNENGIPVDPVSVVGVDPTDSVLSVGAPDIDVDPLLLDFGDLPIGSAAALAVTIGNTGTTPLDLESIALDPASSTDFTITGNPAGTSLGPGLAVDVEITYTPTVIAPAAGVLEIRASDPDPQEQIITVDLRGAGISLRTPFLRGDAEQDGRINITDGVTILGVLFLAQTPPTCTETMDADNDSIINITDGIRVLNYLFLAGPLPLPPFDEDFANGCGLDPDEPGARGDLGCDSHPPCE